MPEYARLEDAIDTSIEIFIFNPTDGLPDDTVVFNTAGLDIDYRREGAANSNITLVDLATPLLSDPHLDGGFLLIGNGWYRLDLPDAACASGARQVTVHGTLTNRVIIGATVHINQEVSLNPATEQQIDDIQTDIVTHLLGFGVFGTVDSVVDANNFTLSSDFENINDHYNGMRCVMQSGQQRGQSAIIASQTGLAVVVGSGLTAAPAVGTVVSIISR